MPTFAGLATRPHPATEPQFTRQPWRAHGVERVPVLIFDDPGGLAKQAARQVRTLIEAKQAAGDIAVLGLPTGSTPIGVYQELIRMHREEGLDFSSVVTFNLDEYVPMAPDSLQSYHRFMRENFFDHVNVPEENIHIPRGDLPEREIETHAAEYERLIQRAGGIDLMLLGIGRSGHIGFNEPGSTPDDRTRLIVLDEITRKDAASDFFEEKYVPREAITMGVGTILDAREVILIATGEHKAPIVRQAVEEEPNAQVSATYLQLHNNATFYVDRAAASELTREKTPWLVKRVEWTEDAAKRAVIWLSKETGKAILRLDASDFHRHHLHDLVHTHGVDPLCQRVFEDLRRRVVYRDKLPKKEKVVVFSPHPDDDVISMGGMLHALVQNGNDVTVAYMTNGSVAVFDQDVRRHLQFVEMSWDVLEPGGESKVKDRIAKILRDLDKKKPAQVDTEAVQKIKAFIRYTEAIAAIEVMGLGAEHARFLDMPFYKTGRVRKDPIGEADVQIVLDLLKDTGATHLFVAGDLSDPHGTHRMCYQAIDRAVRRYGDSLGGTPEADAGGDGAPAKASRRKKKAADDPRPLVWLYRGAWQEWEIDKADVFLPLSKADLELKIEAIYKHESQKDRALFPGAYDDREFWERARDRNTETARSLDALGLPECFAAEAFVTVREMP
ncbi:glucosamine-6-phosphate deaminase [Rubrivirga marina]|uniref:Glucosamine-6-phosphate deaminase n=1 Tax=Rubrivirga marina TaxID=1196024 RepID=A0A271J4W3_9BACT|nr:glucosamine-6-phosphate deaminase [Rubrivirga marina]PAP78317.1 glucosamine-6-phosphate deaminase [Rubrivirga marina]